MVLRKIRLNNLTIAGGLLASVVLPVVLAAQAQAATLTQTFVRFDRMLTSAPTTGTVCVKPATTSTDVKTWTVTFPAGYTVSTTAGNWQTTNISTTSLPFSATAWPNATSATANAVGQTVTWTNAAVQTMNAGTLYCYNWTATAAVSISASATNPNTGSVATQDHLAATIDSGTYSTASIAADQISVSATVSQTFSFGLGGVSDNINTLNASTATQSAGVTATVSTNAKNGYGVFAKDANAGLTSSTAGTTIPAQNGPLSAGTAGYTTDVTIASGGTGTAPTATAPFNGGGTAGNGGGLSTTMQQIAASTGPNGSGQIKIQNAAITSALTPPATDYTDTITVVGAALF